MRCWYAIRAFAKARFRRRLAADGQIVMVDAQRGIEVPVTPSGLHAGTRE